MIAGRRWWHVAALVVYAGLLNGTVCKTVAAESLPTIVAAGLPADQVDAKAWGEPARIDGREVRVIKTGADAILRIKPWWTGPLRPAQGRYWTITVQYKDTANQPIVFSAFGNLAGYWGRTELHRFGGLNDGRWKRAEIPLPWDMVMARPDNGMVEISLRSPGGDVPVASIKIDNLDKKDLAKAAEQYNQETRNWIARVQQAKYSESRNELEPAQKPAQAVTQARQTVVPYVRSYLLPIYPYSGPQAGETGKMLEATMSQNEYEPAAFGVYANGKDLTNVQVRIEGLRHESDKKARLEASVRTVEYALVQNDPPRAPATRGAAAAKQPQRAFAVFPQRLWPMYPTGIKRGQSSWFWVTFRSDPKVTAPGVYTGKAVVTSDQGKAVLPVKVTVLPIRLLDMQEANLTMGACINAMVSRHEMAVMLQHNHNGVQTWLSGVAPRIVPKGKDDFDLDFTLLDDFMSQMKAAGLAANVWFLGGDPFGFPMTLTIQRILAKQVLGLSEEQYAELFTKDPGDIPPRIAPLYRKWVTEVMRHARQQGWPEQVISPFDEPAKWSQSPGRKSASWNKNPLAIGAGPWIKPQFEQGCALIHEAWPGARVLGDIHDARTGLVFLKDIDIFDTNVIAVDPTLGDKTRSAGKTFWQYNIMARNEPHARGRYMLGFFFNAFDARGSMTWGYNQGDRFDTTEGESWEYAWYTPLDVIPAPYYETMREGLDDRRYVETLKKLARDNHIDISGFLADIAETAKDLSRKGGPNTVDAYWTQDDRFAIMDQLRGKVIQKILHLKPIHSGERASSTTR